MSAVNRKIKRVKNPGIFRLVYDTCDLGFLRHFFIKSKTGNVGCQCSLVYSKRAFFRVSGIAFL